MVVDGRVGFVGSDRQAAGNAIDSASVRPVERFALRGRVGAAPGSITVDFARNAGTNLITPGEELVLFVTEDDVQVSVPSGENADRVLRHSSVARKVSYYKSLPSGPITLLVPGMKQVNGFRVVALVQNLENMRIRMAGAARVEK